MRGSVAMIALAGACLGPPACAARGADDVVASVWTDRVVGGVVRAVEATPTPEPPAPRDPSSEPHPEMVEVRPSVIPGAGHGLFATVNIPSGTYIGFYRGELVTPEQSDAMQDTKEGEYLFFLPQCADDEIHDAIAGDMNDYVSKVNYAPRTINRQPTRLQNVIFNYFCTAPYVRLHATRDIEADEELYVDYGPDYDYAFMEIPAVQEHFLRVTGIEKEKTFMWEHAESP